jgi:hypothetical protein
MIFTYKQYRQFLNEINRLGRTQLFKNWKGDNVFLLRHDVDFDIGLAHKLALIEEEEHVVSTFFILTTCESYNALSKKNLILLREMIGMGHEIGLHFDPSLYDKKLETVLEKEIDILSFATRNEIKSISLHNPSIHGQYPIFNGYINAYDPKWFSDDNYISDSMFLFRGKDPYEFLKNINKNMIQILLHPMHYTETGGGYDEIFCDYFIRYINEVHNSFKINSTYLEQVGDDLIAIFKKRMT